jgi:hypothetical protein
MGGAALVGVVTFFALVPVRGPRLADGQIDPPWTKIPPDQTKPDPPKSEVSSRLPRPDIPGGNLIELERGFIRQAAQSQIQVGVALRQRYGASNSLERLNALAFKDDTVKHTIQVEQELYNSADNHLRNDLEKYVSQIDWLGTHDATSVDAAIGLERESIGTVSMDQGDTDAKAAIGAAIGLVAKHVRADRQHLLTADMVTADVGQTSLGGPNQPRGQTSQRGREREMAN